MKLYERLKVWNDRHSILAHLTWMAPLGFVGGWLGAYYTGGVLALISMTSQEWTDQRVYNKLQATTSGKYVCGLLSDRFNWNGWDWMDWIGGVAGGFIFSWIGSLVF
ncbi:MAG: hypothetical protein V3T23_01875 [Nitrososphaerales archaeon]